MLQWCAARGAAQQPGPRLRRRGRRLLRAHRRLADAEAHQRLQAPQRAPGAGPGRRGPRPARALRVRPPAARLLRGRAAPALGGAGAPGAAPRVEGRAGGLPGRGAGGGLGAAGPLLRRRPLDLHAGEPLGGEGLPGPAERGLRGGPEGAGRGGPCADPRRAALRLRGAVAGGAVALDPLELLVRPRAGAALPVRPGLRHLGVAGQGDGRQPRRRGRCRR
mmetsp:Transcript_29607/g.83475  ORF Transcript_29607/g.83475 Transcript_29607/m.83475 type:complete len:220 (+) Transcript_29607:553-1212(+)